MEKGPLQSLPACGAAVLLCCATLLNLCGADANQIYSPVSYFSEGNSTNSQWLVVFPPGAPEFTIPVPVPVTFVSYDPDHWIFWASPIERVMPAGEPSRVIGVRAGPGLVKVSLNPPRVDPVPGSTALTAFSDVRSFWGSRLGDRLILSARRMEGRRRTCGLFELSLPGGTVRPIVETSSCDPPPFGTLSYSPDGETVVMRGGSEGGPRGLVLMNLATGVTKPLSLHDEAFQTFAWSPDGKWIAAIYLVPLGGQPGIRTRTILIDPNDPSKRRDLGTTGETEAVWSPDSRYLLHTFWEPKCPSATPLTFETIEVSNGKRFVLENSRCKVPSPMIGWLAVKGTAPEQSK
jgi:hypothetical protein